jgi:uncharacterized SAM-binding protein YcdF (DUF218 family)
VAGSEHLDDVRLIWDYHRMGHKLRPCPVAIGLGSHDLGVATFAAALYQRDLFPTLLFSGGNSRSTADRFPRGEAVHFREHARALGVPDEAILIEPDSTNTGENITMARKVLAGAGLDTDTVLLISKPYMERRAYATCRKLWPEVNIICASAPISLDDYLDRSGNPGYEINMIVGDLQRVMRYPMHRFAIPQDVPPDVVGAYQRLVQAGFTDRVLPTE